MEANHEEDVVARKPSKQRRIGKQHVVVTKRLPRKAETRDGTGGVLHRLLGDCPSSIRIFDNRKECHHHALKCFQTMLDALILPAMEEVAAWREIHGFVVLQLGNIHFCETNPSSDTFKLIIKLWCCLKEIYKCSLSHKPYTNEELQVAFATATGHLNDLVGMASRTLNADATQGTSIILDLLHTLVKCHEPTVRAVENITVLLVRLLCDFPLESAPSVHQIAHGMLYDLESSSNTKVATITNTSLSVVRLLQQDSLNNEDLKASKRTSLSFSAPTTESLLYLSCMAHSRKGATHLSKNLDRLDALVDCALQSQDLADSRKEMKRRAAETLSTVAINRKNFTPRCDSDDATSLEYDWTMDALLKVLTGAQEDIVKCCTISGLQCCQPANIAWLKSKFLHEVLSSLVAITESDLSLATEKDGCNHGAARIILDIVEPFQVEPSKGDAVLSYEDAISHINRFLRMHSDPALQQLAVAALLREVHRSGSKVALRCPHVLNNLGGLLYNYTVPGSLKQAAIEVFESTTRKNEDAASILARQPKVLEALVTVASGPSSVVDNAPNSKELALVVLMRLSQNVCNRRILAKHVGVLACMIRFARGISYQQQTPGDPEQTPITSICLLDLKKKIMELTTVI